VADDLELRGHDPPSGTGARRSSVYGGVIFLLLLFDVKVHRSIPIPNHEVGALHGPPEPPILWPVRYPRAVGPSAICRVPYRLRRIAVGGTKTGRRSTSEPCWV
jgi:hypothetical protein